MAHLSSSEIYMAAMGQFFKDLGDHRWLSRYLVLTLKLLRLIQLNPGMPSKFFFPHTYMAHRISPWLR